MAKSTLWSAAQTNPQKQLTEWSTVSDDSLILVSDDSSFDYNVQLKIHASKQYEHGTVVGYALSTDKSTRVWQHVDSSGSTKSQKEAYGVLLFNRNSGKVDYKTAGDIPLNGWMVLRRNAQIDASVLSLESTQKAPEIAMQLLNNANIQVVSKSFMLQNVLDKPEVIT